MEWFCQHPNTKIEICYAICSMAHCMIVFGLSPWNFKQLNLVRCQLLVYLLCWSFGFFNHLNTLRNLLGWRTKNSDARTKFICASACCWIRWSALAAPEFKGYFRVNREINCSQHTRSLCRIPVFVSVSVWALGSNSWKPHEKKKLQRDGKREK